MLDRNKQNAAPDLLNEGREEYELDIDRMVNEGLGGGYITEDDNGLIEESVDILSESLKGLDE